MPDATAAPAAEDRGGGLRGFVLGISAYLLWGLLPLYMKSVAHIPPYEVVAERIVWSLPIAVLVLVAQGRMGNLRAVMGNARLVGLTLLTSALISVNWLTYVWAIGAGRALETALGYYINPLVSVGLGALLLGERFSPAQGAAIGLAVIGVAVLTVESGGLPWVSLLLALTFAIYGYLKKTMPVGPIESFSLEVLILTPLGLAYIGWLAATGSGHFHLAGGGPLSDTGLLLLAGPVTAVPMILFSLSTRLLRLSTVGLMQYVAPSMIFLTAVFVFGEPFSTVKLIAFGFIWASLAVYTFPVIVGLVRGR